MILSSIYWIDTSAPGRLAIMARPRAGEWLEDDIAGWRSQAIDGVVSPLERSEIAELELRREPELCRTSAMDFISFPIPDRGVLATAREARSLAQRLAVMPRDGNSVAAHCRTGIGRSSLVADCALVRAGVEPRIAFDRIAQARSVAVLDTERQRNWVGRIAKTAT